MWQKSRKIRKISIESPLKKNQFNKTYLKKVQKDEIKNIIYKYSQ